MALPIITADDRDQRQGIKVLLAGPFKIGKTSQLFTLDPEKTLVLDFEAGLLAVQGWPGHSVQVRSWDQARALAVFLAGPDPKCREDEPYSQTAYQRACEQFGDPAQVEQYDTLFLDSLTVAGRWCFHWCQGQPAAKTKDGKADLRGIYGLHALELVRFVTHLQYAPKNVIFVSILEAIKDDYGVKHWQLQMEGKKASRELPGILDEIISMVELTPEDGPAYRAFICQASNPWGFPAGDRSARLDMIEPPDLGQLMRKIAAPKPNTTLKYNMPTESGEPRPQHFSEEY